MLFLDLRNHWMVTTGKIKETWMKNYYIINVDLDPLKIDFSAFE